MYRYRIAVPTSFSDELASMLAAEASVDVEAVVPSPLDAVSGSHLQALPGGQLAVLLVYGPSLDSVATTKAWLDSRKADVAIDVRGEDPPGQFTFSFQAHSLDELMEWAARRAQKPAGIE